MDTSIDSRLTPDGPPRRVRVVLGIGIALYLLVLGGLAGTVGERIRFDHQRNAALAHYDALLRARNAGLMVIERDIAQRLGPARGDLALGSFEMSAAAAGN
jgi:hypothetical protein